MFFFSDFLFKTLYITNQKFKIAENFIWLRVTPLARAIKDFRKNTWHIFRFFINPSQIERFTQNQDLHKISLIFNNIYIVFHQCEKCKDTFACKYIYIIGCDMAHTIHNSWLFSQQPDSSKWCIRILPPVTAQRQDSLAYLYQ